MEETVPTIHTSMVRCNIFFMTENDESPGSSMKSVPSKPGREVRATEGFL